MGIHKRTSDFRDRSSFAGLYGFDEGVGRAHAVDQQDGRPGDLPVVSGTCNAGGRLETYYGGGVELDSDHWDGCSGEGLVVKHYTHYTSSQADARTIIDNSMQVLSEGGCRLGKRCGYNHDWRSLPDRASRCFVCSALTHRKQDCPAKPVDKA